MSERPNTFSGIPLEPAALKPSKLRWRDEAERQEALAQHRGVPREGFFRNNTKKLRQHVHRLMQHDMAADMDYVITGMRNALNNGADPMDTTEVDGYDTPLVYRLLWPASVYQFEPHEASPCGMRLVPAFESIVIEMIRKSDVQRLQELLFGHEVIRAFGPAATNILASLLACGYDPDATPDPVQEPPMMSYITDDIVQCRGDRWQRIERWMPTIRLLLYYGADPNALDLSRGSTLLLRAVEHVHVPLLRLLRRYGGRLTFGGPWALRVLESILNDIALTGSKIRRFFFDQLKLNTHTTRIAVVEVFRLLVGRMDMGLEEAPERELRASIALREHSLLPVPAERAQHVPALQGHWPQGRKDRMARKEEVRREVVERLQMAQVPSRVDPSLVRKGSLVRGKAYDLFGKLLQTLKRGELDPQRFDAEFDAFARVVREYPFVCKIATNIPPSYHWHLDLTENLDRKLMYYLDVDNSAGRDPASGRFAATRGGQFYLQELIQHAELCRISDAKWAAMERVLNLLINNMDPYVAECYVASSLYRDPHSRHNPLPRLIPAWWLLVSQYRVTRRPLLAQLERLFERGVDPDTAPPVEGMPLLPTLLQPEQGLMSGPDAIHLEDVARLLLRFGADPNQRPYGCDYLPLSAAAQRAVNLVPALLGYGADPNMPSGAGFDVPLAGGQWRDRERKGLWQIHPELFVPPISGRSPGFVGAAYVALIKKIFVVKGWKNPTSEMHRWAREHFIEHVNQCKARGIDRPVEWSLLTDIAMPHMTYEYDPGDATDPTQESLCLQLALANDPEMVNALFDAGARLSGVQVIHLISKFDTMAVDAYSRTTLEAMFATPELRELAADRNYSSLLSRIVNSFLRRGSFDDFRWMWGLFAEAMPYTMQTREDHLPSRPESDNPKTPAEFNSACSQHIALTDRALQARPELGADLTQKCVFMLEELVRMYTEQAFPSEASAERRKALRRKVFGMLFTDKSNIEELKCRILGELRLRHGIVPDVRLFVDGNILTHYRVLIDRLCLVHDFARDPGVIAQLVRFKALSTGEVLARVLPLISDQQGTVPPRLERQVHLSRWERFLRQQLSVVMFYYETLPGARFIEVREGELIRSLHHPDVPIVYYQNPPNFGEMMGIVDVWTRDPDHYYEERRDELSNPSTPEDQLTRLDGVAFDPAGPRGTATIAEFAAEHLLPEMVEAIMDIGATFLSHRHGRNIFDTLPAISQVPLPPLPPAPAGEPRRAPLITAKEQDLYLLLLEKMPQVFVKSEVCGRLIAEYKREVGAHAVYQNEVFEDLVGRQLRALTEAPNASSDFGLPLEIRKEASRRLGRRIQRKATAAKVRLDDVCTKALDDVIERALPANRMFYGEHRRGMRAEQITRLVQTETIAVMSKILSLRHARRSLQMIALDKKQDAQDQQFVEKFLPWLERVESTSARVGPYEAFVFNESKFEEYQRERYRRAAEGLEDEHRRQEEIARKHDEDYYKATGMRPIVRKMPPEASSSSPSSS